MDPLYQRRQRIHHGDHLRFLRRKRRTGPVNIDRVSIYPGVLQRDWFKGRNNSHDCHYNGHEHL